MLGAIAGEKLTALAQGAMIALVSLVFATASGRLGLIELASRECIMVGPSARIEKV